MPKPSFAALAALVLLAAGGVACGRARALESFQLGPHDKVIAEAAGCRAECNLVTSTRRTCFVRDPACRAVCTPLPECRPDGEGPITVCAVVRDGP